MAGTDPAGRIDRLSLEQALKDFEIANARVLDLTQRLIDVTEDNRNLRTELELLRIEHRGLQIDHHAIVASRTYLLARIVQRVVNLVRT